MRWRNNYRSTTWLLFETVGVRSAAAIVVDVVVVGFLTPIAIAVVVVDHHRALLLLLLNPPLPSMSVVAVADFARLKGNRGRTEQHRDAKKQLIGA